MTDSEKENEFWATHLVDETFDLEDCGSPYSRYQNLVKQKTAPFFHGDWVRAEDYRRDIERLENTLKENGLL